MKNIVLCADDYGQAEAISQAILILAKNHRISATSVLVNFPDFSRAAKLLLPFKGQIDIGLHINLTEGKSILTNKPHPHLFRLILSAKTRLLSLKMIQSEINAQLDLFYQEIGELPDFIDGHQHIHQLPMVRQCLIDIYQKRFKDKKSYIRLVNPKCQAEALLKKWVISWSGGSAFKKMLQDAQIPHNQDFAGIYAFKGNFRLLFQKFIAEIANFGIMMCHPGRSNPTDNIQEGLIETDAIAHARFNEFNYLISDDFIQDCRSQGIKLSRFK